MSKKSALILTILIVSMPVAAPAAGAPETGGSLPALCTECHGPDGASPWPDVPIIGGLSAFALEENLFAFREGTRPCRPTYFRTGDTDRPATDMCRIAGELSDDDIVRIAAFLASKPFVPATQQTDPERVARGAKIHDSACHHCHGDGGSDPADHASILAGQWMGYLRLAFVNLRGGRRWMPKTMESRLGDLTDQDVEDLVHFYGSGSHLHESD